MDFPSYNEAVEAREAFRRKCDLYAAWYDAELNSLLQQWVFEVMIQPSYDHIVGYDPQKLLPHYSFEDNFMMGISAWAKEQMKLSYAEVMQDMFPSVIDPDEFISFDPEPSPTSDLAKTLADFMTATVKWGGKVKWGDTGRYRKDDQPIFLEGVRLSYPTLKPVESVKVLRFSADLDYAEIEKQIMASMYDETGISAVVLDLDHRGGDIPGRAGHFMSLYKLQPKKPAVKQNGRSASYLDHDRTKKHGRPNKRSRR